MSKAKSFLVLGLFAVVQYPPVSALAEPAATSPEFAEVLVPPTPTPTPLPDGPACEDDPTKKWENGVCKICAFLVTMFNDAWILDAQYAWDHDLATHTIMIGEHGNMGGTLDRDDVVVGYGNRRDLPVFKAMDTYFQSRLDYCFSHHPTSASECVVYDAKNRFGYYGNPLAYRMVQPYMFWFGDVNHVWVETPKNSGNLERRDTTGNGILFATGGDSWAAAFAPDGSQLDINTLMDPVQDNDSFWWSHTVKFRDDSPYTPCFRWEVKGIASPVALLMPHCDYKELEPTVAKFSLDPRKPDAYSTWQGSSCMPLIAVDPKRTGKITSATQLIGEWTNGGRFAPGKESAKLSPDSDRTKWKHGFQALGSFDTDNNGIVERAELAPLVAWSDANRNGVSDPGEVVSIRKFGVSQLRYRNIEPMYNGDLQVKEGYTAMVKGKKVTAQLIDWYGKVSDSKQELETILPRNARPLPVKGDKESSDAGCTTAKSIGGGWRWWIESDKERKTMGYLTLSPTDDGKYAGNSFSIMDVRRSGSPIRAMLATWPLRGEQSSADEGHLAIESSTGKVLSDIKLGKNGMELTGKTMATSGKGDSKSYTWRAERIGCEQL